MESSAGAFREVTVPVGVFSHLQRAVAHEAGSLAGIHALQAAGHACGVSAAEPFRAWAGRDAQNLPGDLFWVRLSDFLAERGWGILTHESVHPGIGTLASSDWAEGLRQAETEEASCSFSAGFLSGLLSSLAGGPVAVLEVTCLGRGDGACTFAFGNAAAIHTLYGKLLEGSDLGDALATL